MTVINYLVMLVIMRKSENMKIVHICLGAFYPDNYSYQENMLPKFHKQQGHDVEVIASLETFDENGKTSFYPSPKVYQNEYGIKVTRLAFRKPSRIYKKFKRYVGLYQALVLANPDILFIHNCQFLDIDVICKYLRKNPIKSVYVDNHADFSNSATNCVSRVFLHGYVWKKCAKKIEPFTKKFYGVLPARVDFLKNVYDLPAEKCELLVMGADDDLVEASENNQSIYELRKLYNIESDDFLIITGGKIDSFKTQTLLLMDAVKKINDDKVKLLVFGSVTKELKAQVNERVDGRRIQYIGWIAAKESYKYFAASDLVVFPGRHSVFWEQVAAQGIPMICKHWEGTTHVDIGGNVIFLENDSVNEIYTSIKWLLDNPTEYKKMKEAAVNKGKETFLYSSIALRAIEGQK